jgi:hypothetical protein
MPPKLSKSIPPKFNSVFYNLVVIYLLLHKAAFLAQKIKLNKGNILFIHKTTWK